MSKQVEFLVKLRDAAQMMVDAIQEYLESLAPPEAREKFQWNPNAIKWVEADSFKGKYQRYPSAEEKPESTSDYKLLLEDLKKHNGKLTRDGWFYWLFEDNVTVGRKRREVKS